MSEPYKLWFGKFKGISLEEVALGKSVKGGKMEGYPYFHALAKGDRKYFGMFQGRTNGMSRWEEIHNKLNNFQPVYPCVECGDAPTKVSIAGNKRHGYSLGRSFIMCDDQECQERVTSYANNTGIYPLGFGTILYFAWPKNGTKHDQKQVSDFMKSLAGWSGRLTPERATEFIDGLQLRWFS